MDPESRLTALMMKVEMMKVEMLLLVVVVNPLPLQEVRQG
jgi:hypothetical protein